MTNDSDDATPPGPVEAPEAAEKSEASTPVDAGGSPADAGSAPRPPAEGVKRSSRPPPASEEKPATGPEAKLAEALAEAARMREQFLRSAADFDNYRKRSRRDQDDAQRRGRESMLKDILPVFDNLERAATHAETATDVKAVADGIRMVLKQFGDSLAKSGIKRIATVGKAFDPTQHEAVQHSASAEHPAGTILAEAQPGYMIGDYLVRPALVVVSKGPPEGEPANSN